VPLEVAGRPLRRGNEADYCFVGLLRSYRGAPTLVSGEHCWELSIPWPLRWFTYASHVISLSLVFDNQIDNFAIWGKYWRSYGESGHFGVPVDPIDTGAEKPTLGDFKGRVRVISYLRVACGCLQALLHLHRSFWYPRTENITTRSYFS
jgi:hypothetical protein